MFSSVSAKGVGCKKLFGISKKLKSYRRDDKVSIPSHGAIRAVALPDNNAGWCLDSPSYTFAVASTVMYDHLRVHPLKVLSGWSGKDKQYAVAAIKDKDLQKT